LGQALRSGNAALADLPYPIRWAIKAGLITLTVGLIWKYYPRILKELFARIYENLEPWQKATRALTGGVSVEEKATQILATSGFSSEAAYAQIADLAKRHDPAATIVTHIIALGEHTPQALQVLNTEIEQQVTGAAVQGPPVLFEGLRNRMGVANEFWASGFTAVQGLLENVAHTAGAPTSIADIIRWNN
jgi:hypothetical protein